MTDWGFTGEVIDLALADTQGKKAICNISLNMLKCSFPTQDLYQ